MKIIEKERINVPGAENATNGGRNQIYKKKCIKNRYINLRAQYILGKIDTN